MDHMISMKSKEILKTKGPSLGRLNFFIMLSLC